MAPFCLYARLYSLPERQHSQVERVLRQVFPHRFQYGLQLSLVGRFGRVHPVFLKHRAPDVVVKRVEVWRVWRPLVLLDEVRTLLTNPILRVTREMRGRTILLEDVAVWQQGVAVFYQLRKRSEERRVGKECR